MIPIHDLYVFGCFGSGHQLFRPDQSRALGAELYDVERACDGTPVDATVQVEGALVACAVPPGWSYVTWWDRQGDSRLGSHTGILARGTWSAEQLVAAGRVHAPWAFRVPVQVAAVVVVADTLPVSAEAPAVRLARLTGCWRPHMVYDLGDPHGPIFCPTSIEDAGNALQEHGWRPRLSEPATIGCLAEWCREVCGDPCLYAVCVPGEEPGDADSWHIREPLRYGSRSVSSRNYPTEGDAWAAAILAKLEPK